MTTGTAIAIASTTGALTTELAKLAEDARGYASASKAESTIRNYQCVWDHFTAWCAAKRLQALPASPATVALYLTHRSNLGAKPATLALDIAGLGAAHRAAGHEFAGGHPQVKATMAGIRRTLGTRPDRKAPVLGTDLKAMLGTLARDSIQGLRDACLLLIGFGAALRRSELVALDVADVTVSPQGLKITIRRSKTDQEAAGVEIAIPRGRNRNLCAVTAFEDWIAASGITSGPVFRRVRKNGLIGTERLEDRSVASIVKRMAADAGLDSARYSGHSLRAGLATSAALAGANLTSIMKQTRHKSVDVAKTYVRDADLWRDNVSALVM